MTREELTRVVLDALTGVAPEIDPSTIRGTTRLREELDIDSMDFLNFVVAVHKRLRVDIPEADYPHLATLDGAVTYLERKVGP
jgi:acyl carrier protein